MFQEDINRIAVVMAGYSDEEADVFRKNLSKRVPDEVLSQYLKFVAGCIKNGFSTKFAEEIFNLLYQQALWTLKRNET